MAYYEFYNEHAETPLDREEGMFAQPTPQPVQQPTYNYRRVADFNERDITILKRFVESERDKEDARRLAAKGLVVLKEDMPRYQQPVMVYEDKNTVDVSDKTIGAMLYGIIGFGILVAFFLL